MAAGELSTPSAVAPALAIMAAPYPVPQPKSSALIPSLTRCSAIHSYTPSWPAEVMSLVAVGTYRSCPSAVAGSTSGIGWEAYCGRDDGSDDRAGYYWQARPAGAAAMFGSRTAGWDRALWRASFKRNPFRPRVAKWSRQRSVKPCTDGSTPSPGTTFSPRNGIAVARSVAP